MADNSPPPSWLVRIKAATLQQSVAAGVLCLGGAAALAWAWLMWPQWTSNPDLSHGVLALPMLWMLWKRACEEGAREGGLGERRLLAGTLAGMLGLAATLLLATVYAVALGWDAVPTSFLLSAALAAVLGLGILQAAARPVAWVRLGWPVAVLLVTVLLSSPLPPGTYARLTAGLQEAITVGVVETLRFFGVPALRSGNVINLGTTSVGVEEACSGVRSLVSCVLAGLVLSALLLRSPWRRLVLVLVAAPLALLTNFARSLTLTLLARNGVDIAGAWHDWLGFAVLGVTTALLGALAFGMEEAPPQPQATDVATARTSGKVGSVLWRTSAGLSAGSLAVAACWLGFVLMRTNVPAASSASVPSLERMIPASPSGGWMVSTREDLGRFANILQTDHLLERVYSKIDDTGRPVQVTVYAAWWPAGTASVSTVAAHTPEACWPGTGWVSVPAEDGRRDLPLADGRRAGEAEQRSFLNRDYPQTVWFWHLVAGKPLRPFEPRSWRQQLALFFDTGVQGGQEQAFVRISSNLGWTELAGEPLIAEVLAGFAELGVPLGADAAAETR
ncbi:MAG: exosortase/archaeosortase family protein [Opitutaceae bacterium]|nr:exosortase/archaeosortase family protein [Opitutaceae bacterium]